MIIEEKILSDEHLRSTPIYLLTGDLETARLYSTLSSAQSKLGTNIEKIMRSLCQLPVTDWNSRSKCKDKTLFYKTRLHKSEPDFVVYYPKKKKLVICELKTNAFNMDSKQAPTEQKSYTELRELLQVDFKTVEIKIADFSGGAIDKRNRKDSYFNDPLFEIISGETLCSDILEISFNDVMNVVYKDQEINELFLRLYKKKPIVRETISKMKTLIDFFKRTRS